MAVVASRASSEDAAAQTRQHRRVDRCVLDTAPAMLQEETLLRIHDLGIGRRDFEEQGIEQIHAVHCTHPLAVDLARQPRLRIFDTAHGPTLRRYFDYAAATLG